MAKLTWDSLSADIKALIIDEIYRPTDLRSVCLVNKQCHELAVKPLYRYIDLDIGCNLDGRLTACFSPRNIGVQHIRGINLYLADEQVQDKRSMLEQAHLVTRMILELLPEDILERFSWCPWKAFRADNMQLLYKRQRKLKALEVIRLDRDLLPVLEKDEKLQQSIFQPSAKRLFLYPEDRASISLGGFFVKHSAPRLEELTIHANFNNGHDPFEELVGGGPEYIDPRELNDSAREPGLLTRTIFGHQMPFDKCEQFANLVHLSLYKISVRQAGETWCRFIDFKKIEYLYIQQCTGSDALLDQLCKATHLPKQLKAFTLQHADNPENETLLALDGFLCIVSGIRDLVLDFTHSKELPAAAGIARHSKTLELLNVHAWREPHSIRPPTPPPPAASACTGDELVYNREDLETICKACKSLTQLSLAMPSYSMIRPLTSDAQIHEFLIISHLPHLVTLNITSWPSNHHNNGVGSSSGSGPHLPQSVYKTLLQAVALRIFHLAAYWSTQPPGANTAPGLVTILNPDWRFDTPATPKLRIIAFGVSDKIYERQEPNKQILYLRSTARDALGKTQLHAAPIGWCMKQFVEPVSDVLNSTLLRQPKPPFATGGVRERDRGLGWDPEDEDIVDD